MWLNVWLYLLIWLVLDIQWNSRFKTNLQQFESGLRFSVLFAFPAQILRCKNEIQQSWHQFTHLLGQYYKYLFVHRTNANFNRQTTTISQKRSHRRGKVTLSFVIRVKSDELNEWKLATLTQLIRVKTVNKLSVNGLIRVSDSLTK